MTVTLCAALWAHKGKERDLIVYQDKVLEVVREYGGTILQRARTAGAGDEPLEVHILQFPSQQVFDQYMIDPRGMVRAHERHSIVARTEMLLVDLV